MRKEITGIDLTFAARPISYDGLVTWTFCNWGQRHMAENWWRHLNAIAPKARPQVVCLDRDTESYLSKRGVATNSVKPPYEIKGSSLRFRTSNDWTRLTAMKIYITKALLDLGYRQFYSDTDVVAKRDPFPYFDQFLQTHDALFQRNHFGSICSGIYCVNPTRTTAALFDHANLSLAPYEFHNPHYGDQTFIQHRVKQLDDQLPWKFLPLAEFPNGAIWYANRSRITERANLIHYNCVVGSDAKVAEMRSDRNWLLDTVQE